MVNCSFAYYGAFVLFTYLLMGYPIVFFACCVVSILCFDCPLTYCGAFILFICLPGGHQRGVSMCVFNCFKPGINSCPLACLGAYFVSSVRL